MRSTCKGHQTRLPVKRTSCTFAFKTQVEVCLKIKRKRKIANAKIYEDICDLYCSLKNFTGLKITSPADRPIEEKLQIEAKIHVCNYYISNKQTLLKFNLQCSVIYVFERMQSRLVLFKSQGGLQNC